MLALEVDKWLDDMLEECKKNDGQSKSWHLKKALKNYFISKRIKKVVADESKKKT